MHTAPVAAPLLLMLLLRALPSVLVAGGGGNISYGFDPAICGTTINCTHDTQGFASQCCDSDSCCFFRPKYDTAAAAAADTALADNSIRDCQACPGLRPACCPTDYCCVSVWYLALTVAGVTVACLLPLAVAVAFVYFYHDRMVARLAAILARRPATPPANLSKSAETLERQGVDADRSVSSRRSRDRSLGTAARRRASAVSKLSLVQQRLSLAKSALVNDIDAVTTATETLSRSHSRTQTESHRCGKGERKKRRRRLRQRRRRAGKTKAESPPRRPVEVRSVSSQVSQTLLDAQTACVEPGEDESSWESYDSDDDFSKSVDLGDESLR